MHDRDRYPDGMKLNPADFFMTGYGHHLPPHAGYIAPGNNQTPENGLYAAGNRHLRDNGFYAAGNRRLQDNGFSSAVGARPPPETFFFADNNVQPHINSYHYFNNYHNRDNMLDSLLESEFNGLSISTPTYHQSPYGGASEINNMQSLRAQFAAKAQYMGLDLYGDPRIISGSYENNLNQFPPIGSFNGYPYNHGRGNFSRASYHPRAYQVFDHCSDYVNPSFNLRPAVNNGNLRSSRRPILLSLEDLRGKITLAAKDPIGCQFLQNKFGEGNREDIQSIFLEVKDHICDLMTHQFGNYLIQKLFMVCNEEQMTQLLCLIINDERKFKDICTDTHGTRAVQKFIEHLKTPDQRSLVVSVLRRITLDLIKNSNGQHVIQQCFICFPNEDNKHILKIVADNCIDIATDKSGCCVLQQCLTRCDGESLDRLIAQITSSALMLSEHPYGNYVVQYILGFKIVQLTSDIMSQLSGNYVSLSMNKYGSNVVEQCLRRGEEDQALPIIEELIYSPYFLSVLQHPYGNYVAQCALIVSKGEAHDAIVKLVLNNYPFLHSHPHGKRVLARLKLLKRP